MKIFNLKSNLISNFFKKNILIKNITRFFENIKNLRNFANIKKKIIDNLKQSYEKKFKINYLIFIISIIFFYYLVYLSFPGILHNKSDQNYFTNLLKTQYGLEFALTPEINYSILPKPHFQINDAKIFNKKKDFQKEIAEIKKIKIYVFQNNFFKKKNLKIKSVELIQSNFFFDKFDIPFLKSFFIKGFSERPINVRSANLFYQDTNKGTVSFLNLNKVFINYNDKIKQDILISEGDIYNIPFNLSWKQDKNKLEQTTNLKFKKIKLQISNVTKLDNKEESNKLQIYLNRSRYIVNYDLKDNMIEFLSDNSFIGNDKFTFSGKIFSDPFNFNIKSFLDSLKLKKLLSNSIFLREIFSNDFILNENFNGKINLVVEKLENNPLFDKLYLNANFVGKTLDLSYSSFINDKIANLNLEKGVLYEDNNDLIFRGNFDFIINNLKKFNNKFVIPKKNRINLKKINFEVIINLTNSDFKILKIVNDTYKENEFEQIDELIYEFNSGGIKISNWIEFKNFTNKIISTYSG